MSYRFAKIIFLSQNIILAIFSILFKDKITAGDTVKPIELAAKSNFERMHSGTTPTFIFS